VIGATGPDGARIRKALVAAARNMTTLDVRMDQLRTAISPYPVVKDLSVSTQFPHGMRIRVLERPPVAMVAVAGRNVAVASDGTLLHDFVVSSPLPLVPLAVPPGGPRVTSPALQAVKLLAAAPAQLLAKVAQVTTMPGHGLVAQLRAGPNVYFGDASSARAKWIAATAVLADPGSAGASYVDVTDPVRPAAGAGAQAGSGAAGGGSSTSSGGSSSASSGSSSSATSGGASSASSGG